MKSFHSVSLLSKPAHQRTAVGFLSPPAQCPRLRLCRKNSVDCNTSLWRSQRQADVRCRFQQTDHSVLADTTDKLSENADDSKFCWERNWYPVVILVDVDGSKPIPVKLLGKKLVLWEGSQGQWFCVADRCTHRYSPLSGEYQFIAASQVALTTTSGPTCIPDILTRDDW